MSAHGSFFWNELNTWDVEKAKAFYAQTMGWTYEPTPTDEAGPYWLAKSEGQPVAGILPLTHPTSDGLGEFWLPYLSVDDVDARLKAALKEGATIVRPLWDIPETGRRVVIREPAGALVAWMTPLGD